MQLNHNEKIVSKPWGIGGIGEIWHCLSKDFCAKTIKIAKGYKTSFQWHRQKEEINFIRKGECKLLLENEVGEIKEYSLKEGDSFFVPATRKHRVIAVTDIEMFEVSNEFVDDVVRIADEFNRTDGKIEDEHKIPAVLLLAAGKGERVKSITRGLHKALLKINGKAAISHLIEKVDPLYDIVIALGHNGNLVRDYVSAAHPERKFTFVNVPDFESPESGPGKSALACRDHLARPFYLATIDVLFEGSLPPLDCNWIGVSPTDLPEIYSTANVDNNSNVTDFKNKSKEGFGAAFIGLAGIRDHTAFWNNLGNSREVVTAFERRENFPLKAREFDWHDLGTVDGYRDLIKDSANTNLTKKLEEDTYIVNGKVVKLNSNIVINRERIERAGFLGDLVPKVTGKFDYCFSYDLSPGKTLYEWNHAEYYKKFIDFFFDRMVTTETSFGYTQEQKFQATRRFYLTKTEERLSAFYKENPGFILKHGISWGEVFDVKLYKNFHGDLQPDNIIYDGETFVLIDWRNSFAGLYDGDLYYDLAKLYGGLSFNYFAAKNLDVFEFTQIGDQYSYKVPQNEEMKIARDYFEKKIVENNLNLKKVKMLTGLIWLNMSPLHLSPMSKICYLEGVKMVNANL